MKRSNFLLLTGSSIVCAGLLFSTYKLLPKKSTNNNLARYDNNSLAIAHENNYTPDEISDLRNSFSNPYIFSEVLFEETPTKGKYVNKNVDGSRDSYGNSYCNTAPRERTIWIFGGSTTYGYGVADNQTIPSQLAKELSLRGKQYCVINYGRGFFYSNQELLLYTKLISQSSKKPKYVFFVDGLNDYYHLLGSSYVPRYNNPKIIAIINKVFHNRFTSKIFGPPYVFITSNPTVPKDCNFAGSSISDSCKTLVKAATRRLINNWVTADRLSTAYGITFTPLLQPVPLYKHYFVNPFSKGSYGQHRLSGIGYSMMDEETYSEKVTMKKLNFIDASTIFSSPTDFCKMPYVDPVHYSRCGNKLIAKLMSQRVEH